MGANFVAGYFAGIASGIVLGARNAFLMPI
jgi:hypothetical protein